jgi:ABC-2 type transport system permease protein
MLSTGSRAALANASTEGTARRRRGRVARLGVARARVELLAFRRDPAELLFNVAFPVLMLLLLGSTFDGPLNGTGGRAYLTCGVLAYGLCSTAFSLCAGGIALSRHNGSLRRLAGTPLPTASFLLGKVLLILAVTGAEAFVVLGIGFAWFDLPLPAGWTGWATLGGLLALGTTACALAGVGYARLVPSAEAVPAMVAPPYILLGFVSGVWYTLSALPAPIQTVAALFPMKWFAQGLRGVFLTDPGAEPAGTYEPGRVALVLALWCAVALLAALATFRWRPGRRG